MTPHPATGVTVQTRIDQAARVSLEIRPHDKQVKLIHYLQQNQHSSPFEHIIYTFMLRCPIMVRDHLVKHRTFSMNIESSRYSQLKDEFYVPSEFRIQSKSNKQSSADVHAQSKYFSDLTIGRQEAGYMFYQEALDNGVAREQARALLSNYCGMYENMIITCDLHNLSKFFALRVHQAAQWETQWYAAMMFMMVYETYKGVAAMVPLETCYLAEKFEAQHG